MGNQTPKEQPLVRFFSPTSDEEDKCGMRRWLTNKVTVLIIAVAITGDSENVVVTTRRQS